MTWALEGRIEGRGEGGGGGGGQVQGKAPCSLPYFSWSSTKNLLDKNAPLLICNSVSCVSGHVANTWKANEYKEVP